MWKTDVGKKAVMLLLFWSVWLTAWGQYGISWDDFVASYIEENGEVEQLKEEWLEELSELHASPLDINRVDSVTLLRFPFLDVRKVQAILAYRKHAGPLQTLSELQLIPGLDYRVRNYMSLFFYCGDGMRDRAAEPWNKRWFGGRHELTGRLDVPLYERDGYKDYTEEELLQNPNKRYLGNALYHAVRYRYRYGEQIAYGATLEKDAGEPFGAAGNYPYDSFSGYLMLQPKRRLYNLVVGDYRLSFGQGLVVGSGFGHYAPSVLRRPNGSSVWLRKFSSTNEVDNFRGVAATLKFGSLHVVPFVSYKTIDANLDGEVITSFKEDGYHRTQLERSKKGNTHVWSTGAHVGWLSDVYSIGFSGILTGFSRQIVPREDVYRRYYLRGDRFGTYSVDYHYKAQRWNVEGEAAVSDKGGYALLNTVRCMPADWLQLVSQQRFYSYRYTTPYAYAYGAGSRVQNEEGVYVAAESRLGGNWQLNVWGDVYYFPWLTSRTRSASMGWKGGTQLRYSVDPVNTWVLAYQLRMQERDEGKDDVLTRIQAYRNKIRLQWQNSYAENLRWVVSLDGICNRDWQTRYGWMVSGRVHWQTGAWKLALATAYFDTDSYDERIYMYEPNLLYAMSFPMCYYRGVNEVGMMSYELSECIQFSCKYKLTAYLNRTTIGSAQQQIHSNVKQDLSFQLRCLF